MASCSVWMHAASNCSKGMLPSSSRSAVRPSPFHGIVETPAFCATRLEPILSPSTRMTGEVGPMNVISLPSCRDFSMSISPSFGFSDAWPQPTITASTFCEMQRSTISCMLA